MIIFLFKKFKNFEKIHYNRFLVSLVLVPDYSFADAVLLRDFVQIDNRTNVRIETERAIRALIMSVLTKKAIIFYES